LTRRRRAVRWGVIAALALAAGLAVLVGRWYWLRRSLAWQAQRGLLLLTAADSPQKLRLALDRWETETGSYWHDRREQFTAYLFDKLPLHDPRVRLLLTRVAGADYGARRADWQRWYEARRRLRHGLAPDVSRQEAVRMELLWVAPVGLTSWFSTVLVVDGDLYVASLGAAFNDARDVADGVVRVNGVDGASEVFFSPPATHRGPRDVVGLAVADAGLAVACYNGSVYSVDTQGALRWSTHVGDPIVGGPLCADVNRDGATDVIVATRGGKVAALSGRGGRTLWAAGITKAARHDQALGATLALGRLGERGDPDLIVSFPDGALAIVSPRNGQLRWREELAVGVVSGAVVLDSVARRAQRAGAGGNPTAFVADRAANVWSLEPSAGGWQVVHWQALALRPEETLVAGLRTMGLNRPAATPGPWLLACPTGEYAAGWGGLCALSPGQVQWRLPVDGAVWGPPAVGDLNGDGMSEIVLGTVQPTGEDGLAGAVWVISSQGHCLVRQLLDAPIETGPVLADVDRDGLLEIVVADQSGRLHCFKTRGFGPVEWGMPGGDSHNTRNAANAYAYGQLPPGYQWSWRPD